MTPEILTAGIEFTAATTRWADNTASFYKSGTVWYGIMCRSFLLLERALRCCVVEVSKIASEDLRKAAERRALGKPIRAMTMGQCFGVLEEIAPALSGKLASILPDVSREVLPSEDRFAWNRIISMRNRLAHKGPGFLDTVDLIAGRIWREYKIEVPLEQQAHEVWQLGRQLYRSALVVACAALQGTTRETFHEQLDRAELTTLMVADLGSTFAPTIARFHARASELGE